MNRQSVAVVSARGARRWDDGHCWIFRSDVRQRPSLEAGTVRVVSDAGQALGWALWSPSSEISLRLLDRHADLEIDEHWWQRRIRAAVERRDRLVADANAYRLVHAEGDALPSLVCDRYDRWLVVQLLSAGLERFRDTIVRALVDATGAAGVLARNDAAVRDREGLPREVITLHGEVPDTVEVQENGVRYLAALRTGQKTGAFLDQRENRQRVGALARGHALDCFSYHGSFALHLARRASSVVAVDSSADALARARHNAELNGLQNVTYVHRDVSDALRHLGASGDTFDTIVVDPPAFAKNRPSLGNALRGYHDLNVRAMRLLARGGLLFTASCSYHVTKPLFLEMLQGAAADCGRKLCLRELAGQPPDHPEIVTIPETGYLKAALLEAMD
jgi:23S rRNA (cytosine1962-C5)-methyltransferase